MDVFYGLCAVFAAVIDDSVAVGETELFCGFGYSRKNICDYRCVFFGYIVCAGLDMILGNEDDMNGRLRCDIFECKNFIVFVNFC